jgi:dTDP-4-dehydrorhamnose reductase
LSITHYTEDYDTSLHVEHSENKGYAYSKIIAEKYIQRNKNYVIVRIGPLYGERSDGVIDNRTDELINTSKSGKYINAYANVYKTFINVQFVSNAICELIKIEFNGIIHLGNKTKQSFYEFYLKQAKLYNINSECIKPVYVSTEEKIQFDTSMDISKSIEVLNL